MFSPYMQRAFAQVLFLQHFCEIYTSTKIIHYSFILKNSFTIRYLGLNAKLEIVILIDSDRVNMTNLIYFTTKYCLIQLFNIHRKTVYYIDPNSIKNEIQ